MANRWTWLEDSTNFWNAKWIRGGGRVELIQRANISGLVRGKEVGPDQVHLTPLSFKHLGHFVVGLLGRRANPLANSLKKSFQPFWLRSLSDISCPAPTELRGGREGKTRLLRGRWRWRWRPSRRTWSSRVRGSTPVTSPRLLEWSAQFTHIHQHQEQSPRNNYDEDQLRIQALETIPTNVLSLKQRQLRPRGAFLCAGPGGHGWKWTGAHQHINGGWAGDEKI